MRIRVRFGDGSAPNRDCAAGRLALEELLEGDQEFLEELALRLNEIVCKPRGRFVISYVSGQPGARGKPTIH